MRDFIDRNDAVALNQAFGKRLAFGTAGLRGRMGAGPSCMNELVVLQAAQGIARRLLAGGDAAAEVAKRQGVLIGHDHRHNSHRFALSAAAVFLHVGLKVYIMPHMVPTPLVPWGIRKLGCVAGAMVTASHNPKQDNGFKVYWGNTAQIIPPLDQEIYR